MEVIDVGAKGQLSAYFRRKFEEVIPPGGVTGEILAKSTTSDFDTAWQSLPEINPEVTAITYNVSDLPDRIDFADGTYRLITYTGADLVDQVARYDAGAQLIETFQASYDGSDRFTGWNIP